MVTRQALPPGPAARPRTGFALAGVALSALALAGSCVAAGGPEPGADELVTEHVEHAGFALPRAVVHDPVADVYLLSNAPAGFGPADSRGFISRIAPDGRVLDPRWIDGGAPGVDLHEPGGLAIRADTLLVADGRCVRRFDRASGRSIGTLCPAGVATLHAIAVHDDVVYVVDDGAADGAGAVGYGVAAIDVQGGVRAVADDGDRAPRFGVAAGPWGIFVTGAGPAYVSQVTPAGLRPVLSGSSKRIGGIVATRAGGFAFSNPGDSAVHFVKAGTEAGRGSLYTLARGVAEPGHPGYDALRDRLLVPETGRNRLIIVRLSD
jgi:hypothetical protein